MSSGKNQTQNVKQVIIHDNFIDGTFENDIALLVLTEGLDIHSKEFSVSLPKRNTNYIVCKKAYPAITDKHMCAANRDRRYLNDCDGFLVCTDKYYWNDYLCGIISIGNNYIEERPTLFTNIQSSIGWIHASVMKLGTTNFCQKHEFQCNISNVCIHQKLVCDGRNDCGSGDNSDDENCKDVNGCHWSQHGCRKGNQCIPGHLKCDGKLDCKDASDEENCPRSRNTYSMENCFESQFFCNVTTICISLKDVCNGANDCGFTDTSDEENCRDLDGCHPTQFACHKGNKCIPKIELCDQKIHCRDGSDEKNCTSTERTHGPIMCKVSNKKYGLTDICDGIYDCGVFDGSDEENCQRGKHGCLWTQFSCRLSKRCISGEQKCDGVIDCEDGSDEQNCLRGSACYWTHFACPNRTKCIPRSYISDGWNDCSDDSDEERCDNGSRCHWSEFECHDKIGCIPGHFYFDGVTHCSDGSDERDTLNETLETNTGTLAPYWYSLLGIVIILGIPLIILYRKYRQRSDLLTALEIDLFKNGDGNQIRAGQFAHENAQFIPYNQEFEIKWKDLLIKTKNLEKERLELYLKESWLEIPILKTLQ
ncbi:unnamed protein product [Allacma fusca]|uniref:Uncharacterized protein n=1 Tax=Allacma fusca TaxID=39272 RepID=A0A8J2JLZ2_9HEXA|nr:unnamed protein product [Allacma fusca]